MSSAAYNEVIIGEHGGNLAEAWEQLKNNQEERKADLAANLQDVDEVGFYIHRQESLYDLKGEYREGLIKYQTKLLDDVTAGVSFSDTIKKGAFANMIVMLKKNLATSPTEGSTLSRSMGPDSWAKVLFNKEDYAQYTSNAEKGGLSDNIGKYSMLYEMLKKEEYRNIYGDRHLATLGEIIQKAKASLN